MASERYLFGRKVIADIGNGWTLIEPENVDKDKGFEYMLTSTLNGSQHATTMPFTRSTAVKIYATLGRILEGKPT